jgi:hypothetical protein
MRYLVIILLFLGSLNAYPSCAPELQTALSALYAYPESRKVIAAVEQSGPITIFRAPFESNSSAMWNGYQRAIILNARFSNFYGESIRSICFEMFNAIAEKEFVRLDNLARRRQISKKDYVLGIEKLEHQNALAVCALIERGIQKGYFPPSSRWYMPQDFDRYFEIQQRCGHSGAIAAVYDRLSTPYG